uniref:cytochrome c biogenesis protein ResB n=1 Tax=Candidatus Magnetaquicoccus inordinatus TaxID=2496818 RepID=UPI00102C2F0E
GLDTALAWLASLRLTILSLALLVGGGLLVLRLGVAPTLVLAVPFSLLGINLVAVLFFTAAFRRRMALQVFHLALLVIVLLAAFSRLTYFKGQFELSAGERFAGRLLASEQGPWHLNTLDQIDFINEAVDVDFATGGVRGPTRNTIRWFDARKVGHQGVIGDNIPLVVQGYRIYPSRHFGYAPLFSWQPALAASSYRGTVHLPDLSLGPGASNDWTLPGTSITALVMLQLEQPVPDLARPSRFVRGVPHLLRVTLREESRDLKPGDAWLLPEGTLLYEGLETWMGYTLFYDPAIPWLLAAALVAIASLLLHFFGKFARKPWYTVER